MSDGFENALKANGYNRYKRQDFPRTTVKLPFNYGVSSLELRSFPLNYGRCFPSTTVKFPLNYGRITLKLRLLFRLRQYLYFPRTTVFTSFQLRRHFP